jgi:hypothetical protein
MQYSHYLQHDGVFLAVAGTGIIIERTKPHFASEDVISRGLSLRQVLQVREHLGLQMLPDIGVQILIAKPQWKSCRPE